MSRSLQPAFRFFLCLLFFPFGKFVMGQDTINAKPLTEIVVRGFENNRKLVELPAAIGTLNQQQLMRFGNTSLLNAINTLPGARMEERSPGSYRLSMRGSSLRSPFGVRNVKVYLNDIPFTEPGGTTYLNQLGFYNVQSIEVLKGPSGSLYGAGNGGTVLLKTYGSSKPSGFGLDYSTGSFELQNINLFARVGSSKNQQTITWTRLQSNGYREWTKNKKDIISWDGHFSIKQHQLLNTFLMYGDLFYQTPGGLTPQQFTDNPKQARPQAGQLPGSQQANASISQKMLFGGISYSNIISPTLKNTVALYGAISRIDNPSIRNYEKRKEPHAGARIFFTYQPNIAEGELKIIAGTELQNGWYRVSVFGNINGHSDTVQTDDKVRPFTWSSFAQAEWKLHQHWILSAGASLTTTAIAITRQSVLPVITQKRTYNNEVSPRLAILRKLGENASVYTSVAKGFSPPTSAEVLPSTGVINSSLNAEEGWNYEGGARASFMKGKLFIDVNSFFFSLRNAIVQRRDTSGADFFTNAGATKQQGIEGYVKYNFVNGDKKFIRQCNLWLSYTYSNFTYKNFKQLTADYSGKQLPGIPKNNVVAGLDVWLNHGIFSNLTYIYTDPTLLNDANSFSAGSYQLLNVKIGIKQIVARKMNIAFFAGADNLLNQTYSLGNDINAAANRFFNVAPARNYFVGISLFQQTGKHQSPTGTSL